MKLPETITDFELKLEGVGASHSLYVIDYTPEPQENGYVKYRVPLADFTEMDFTTLRIPFSLWNPKFNEEDGYGEVWIDNIAME